MLKSLCGAITGSIVGAAVGFVIGAVSSRPGDTSSIIYAGRGLIAVIGVGLGAITGTLIGSTSAILDTINRTRHPA